MTFDVDEDFILKCFTTFSLLIPCGGGACGKRGSVGWLVAAVVKMGEAM